MAQRKILVGRVLCVAWRTPEQEDLAAIIDELRQGRARLNRRLLYLSVIGPKSLPEGKVRDALVGFYRDILTYCDSMHIVLEGNEFELSIKRSVIANVLLVVQARGRVFIENTLDRVREVAHPDVRGELSDAMRAAAATNHFAYARSEPPSPPKAWG